MTATNTARPPQLKRPPMDEKAKKRLRDAYLDGVPELELLKRFQCNHAQFRAAVQGLKRGERQ